MAESLRIRVVDPVARPLQVSERGRDRVEQAPGVASLMWLPVPNAFDVERFAALLADVPGYARRSDVVILGLHPVTMGALRGNPSALLDVRKRLEGHTPYFLTLDGRGQPIVMTDPAARPDPDVQFWSDVIRPFDVAAILRRSGTELPKTGVFHYEGPNGSHYAAFLRPGFAVRSVAELDRLCFWLIGALRGRSCLLVDHWSMIGLGYHLGAYARQMGQQVPMRVESLRSYDEDPEVIADRLRLTFGVVPGDSVRGDGGIIISVNSSGRLVREVMRPALEDGGFLDPPVQALAETPSGHVERVPALTTLEDSFSRFDGPGHCLPCSQGATAVLAIQKDTYLLELAAFTQRQTIDKTDSVAGKKFVERYAGKDVFWVHRTHQDGRHQAFYVDVEKMLQNEAEFKRRLEEAVQLWAETTFDVIVHPPFSAAKRLATLVSERLPIGKTIETDEVSLGQLDDDDRELLASAQNVLVVDDVVITGARLAGYRRHLIQLRRKAATEEYFDLHCLVAVARPETEQRLQGITDVAHHRTDDPRFLAVEEVLLPNWDGNSCPWCRERTSLGGLPGSVLDSSPWLRKRIERLDDPGGLKEALYIPWATSSPLPPQGTMPAEDWERRVNESTSDAEDAQRYFSLAPGSIFGEVQEADLAVSVAAAMQRMRSPRKDGDGWKESKLDDSYQAPISKVLEPNLYLQGRFYEPVIVAAILRAARRHDIRVPGGDKDIRAVLRRHASTPAWNNLRAELAFAMASGFLPVEPTLLDTSTADPAISQVISALLNLRQR